MDDESAPRMAPPPKPTLLQITVPRPEVPEVSLLFDSDDSLIWQRAGGERSNDGVQTSVLGIQQRNILHSKLQSLKENPLTGVGITEIEKENSPKELPIRKPQQNSQAQRFISSNIIPSSSQKDFDSYQSKQFSPRSFPKEYNPFVYSPLPKKTDKASPVVVPSQKHRNPLASRSENIMKDDLNSQVNRSPVGFPTSREVLSEGIYGTQQSQALPAMKKTVHFEYASPTEASVRSKALSDSPGLASIPNRLRQSNSKLGSPSSLQENVYNRPRQNAIHRPSEVRHSHTPPMEASDFAQLHSLPTRNAYVDNQYRDSRQEIRQAPLGLSYNASATQQLESDNVHHLYELSAKQPSLYPSSGEGIQRLVDPNVCQLIEDQNQHILKLYKTLETFLEKKHTDGTYVDDTGVNKIKPCGRQLESAQVDNCNSRHCSTQTDTLKPTMQSVGTNTDLSWSDIISLARGRGETVQNGYIDRVPSNPRQVRQDELVQGVQRAFQKNESREAVRTKVASSYEQRRGGEVKEISLTMREVVMTTIQEDQPSPEPSLHIDMEEYREDSVTDTYMEKPNVQNANNFGRSSPEVDTGASLNHRQNQSNPYSEQHENDHKSDPSNKGTKGTFYNNVMTNIQHILQSSKTNDVEEEDLTGEEKSQTALRHQHTEEDEEPLDPQLEAVKRQLLQFGISFIDPTSNQRPIMDTMYLPGLHNMLSVYQSTIMSPYPNVFKESDATAAKYLTDAQLAAIASMSPVMKEQNKTVTASLQARGSVETNTRGQPFLPRQNLQPQESHSTHDNNLSIATKKFLFKYGLKEHD